MIRNVKLSNQARDQLIRLKTRTGIDQWNILCRWALCVSLKEPTPPTPIDYPADSNVEMTWQTFGGEHHELCFAIVKEHCDADGLDPADEKVVGAQFRLHLHRGIGYLATPGSIKSIDDLARLVLDPQTKAS